MISEIDLMKFSVALAIVIGVGLLACSSAVPAPVEPTPNIEATVEARLKEEKASIPTATPVPTYTPIPTATPVPTYTPMPTYTPEPTPLPTATAVPEPTPLPTATAVPDPTPHPWGSRVVYFDNAVYFLTPVSKLKAEQYLEFLKDTGRINPATDKHYQLRGLHDRTGLSYEIRNGFYKMSELRYYTSYELDDYLSTVPYNDARLTNLREGVCTRQYEIFNGALTTYKWVGNPNSGFEDVVLMANCDNVWAVRDGISTKLR
jgi:hypothetical protein